MYVCLVMSVERCAVFIKAIYLTVKPGFPRTRS